MKILDKEILTIGSKPQIIKMVLLAPDIAKKALPGQFIVIMTHEEGERVPLTVVNKDINAGTIQIIVQEAGFTTKLLSKLNIGDSLYAIVGPLGHATEIKKYGKVILIGGGVGIAEIYPVTKALKQANNEITTIIGARTKNALILEEELKSVTDNFFVATDDGSYGIKGFTTNILKDLLTKDKYDLAYAVGPIPMMRIACSVTKPFNVKTIVSLNSLMVDVTGMCGCCRVTVDGKSRFTCIDGPDFDGHLVDWDMLEKRNNVYTKQEKHLCNLHKL